MSSSGFHVIDVHHHVGGVPSAMGQVSAAGVAGLELDLGPFHDPNEVGVRLAVMDANGIDQAVVIPTHEYLRPDGEANTRQVNDAIAGYRDRNRDRFPAAVGIAEPLHGRRAFDELQRARDELGLIGISFHTRFQGVSTDSYLVRGLVERMADLGLVPFMHAYAGSPDEAPWMVTEVAKTLPEVPMIVLDGFSGLERSAKEISIAAATVPNLVFDTSLAYSFDIVERFVANFGAERVLFGTDMYSPPLAYRKSTVLEQLLDSGLDDDQKAMILSGNFQRLVPLGSLGSLGSTT
jgi:predicted TIM-barrel fold metal-dependent hydrolase